LQSGDLIERIYGRDDLAIFLPGGRVLLASSFSEIYSKILYELKTNKLKDTKIIQHSLSKIEIQVVIDEKLRNEGVSIQEIFSLLESSFQKKVGPQVEIIVREVKGIDKKGPRIISKINRNKFKIREYV